MTKSTGKGRGKGGGGAKPGAGRPRKAIVAQAISPETRAAARRMVEKLHQPTGPASSLVPLAYATLMHVMEKSLTDSPRVTAALKIIDLAKAEQASANAPTGKKAAMIDAAHGVATTPTDGWGDDLMAPGSRAN